MAEPDWNPDTAGRSLAEILREAGIEAPRSGRRGGRRSDEDDDTGFRQRRAEQAAAENPRVGRRAGDLRVPDDAARGAGGPSTAAIPGMRPSRTPDVPGPSTPPPQRDRSAPPRDRLTETGRERLSETGRERLSETGRERLSGTGREALRETGRQRMSETGRQRLRDRAAAPDVDLERLRDRERLRDLDRRREADRGPGRGGEPRSGPPGRPEQDDGSPVERTGRVTGRPVRRPDRGDDPSTGPIPVVSGSDVEQEAVPHGSALAWLRFAGELVVALAAGIGIFFLATVLWEQLPYAAVILAPLAVTGLVAGVAVWRERMGREPVKPPLLAVLVLAGVLLTVLPAAELIPG